MSRVSAFVIVVHKAGANILPTEDGECILSFHSGAAVSPYHREDTDCANLAAGGFRTPKLTASPEL